MGLTTTLRRRNIGDHLLGYRPRRGRHFDDSTDWAVVQADDYDDEYSIPTNPIGADEPEADSDGSTAEFSISIRAIYTWYRDAGETIEYQDNFVSTVNVDVKNEESNVSASGTGRATGE